MIFEGVLKNTQIRKGKDGSLLFFVFIEDNNKNTYRADLTTLNINFKKWSKVLTLTKGALLGNLRVKKGHDYYLSLDHEPTVLREIKVNKIEF